MGDKTYDMFISSSHKDRAWVSEFVAALQKEGLHPWSDEEISPGDKWAESIEKALRDSSTLIMVLSPDFLLSDWIFFELGAAIAGKKRIIPVITKELAWSQIPLMLRRYQFLNESSPSIAGKRVAEVVGKHENAEAS
ncbi:MAG: toll/interleukin-1 receptor domain-containing protein [Proteobacteria bacterium]|nr:toll/interleukin-1 receptor domain-containing protein [Pseudomonadota bacterium]